MLLSGLLSQTAEASLIYSGVSTLAASVHANCPSEDLSIYWSVDLTSGVYTYTYNVFNPVGDVVLDNAGHRTSTPEVVVDYSVAFTTTIPGAVLPASQIGGFYRQNNGVGLKWYFSEVAPGDFSGPLSFESYLPPALGNANAMDANPPSPWSSTPPTGQQVLVPGVPEPTTLLAGMLLLLPFRSTALQFIRKREKTS